MEIIEAYATKNRCYQTATPLYPQGIMLHSIGCPQPNASTMAHMRPQQSRSMAQMRPVSEQAL